MLESVFIAQKATLITHGHFFREKYEKPRFHVWPLLCAYKTAEEPISRWKKHCHTINGDSCCAPGHHFVRITQYPLNTPDSYYEHWKKDSVMAQYCYLQDEYKKQAVYPPGYLEQMKEFEEKYGKPINDPSANKSIYFGDDGKELINPDNRYASNALQNKYFGMLNGRGGDIGCHFRSWWLKKHGYVENEQVIWPEGDNPNGW